MNTQELINLIQVQNRVPYGFFWLDETEMKVERQNWAKKKLLLKRFSGKGSSLFFFFFLFRLNFGTKVWNFAFIFSSFFIVGKKISELWMEFMFFSFNSSQFYSKKREKERILFLSKSFFPSFSKHADFFSKFCFWKRLEISTKKSFENLEPQAKL